MRSLRSFVVFATLVSASFASAASPRVLDEVAFRTFLSKRQPATVKSAHAWRALAKRLLPKEGPLKPVATHAEAATLFEQFRGARIGTGVPLDGCAPRADVAAVAAMRAGFEVQKLNYFALGGPLEVLVGGMTLKWSFHVAPVIMVGDAGEKPVMKVLDPSLFDRPVLVSTWRRRMRAATAMTFLTSPHQLSYRNPELTGDARIEQLAVNLAAVSGLRQFEQSRSTTTPVASFHR